jgi:uracil-DNA glycosylase family 4
VTKLEILRQDITGCTACSRLIEHCRRIAEVKRRAYRDCTYWGKPVASFGDPQARLLIIGLAPGAHGANRTGRVFTGDASGDLLYRVLHSTGFASKPFAVSATDGLELRDAYIAASVRCAPPDNKPTREEILRCRPFLVRELELLRRVRVVVALGRIAFDNYLDVLRERGLIRSRAPFRFAHNAVHQMDPILITSYHPSRQNTSTGKLTEDMLRAVFENASTMLRTDRNSGP